MGQEGLDQVDGVCLHVYEHGLGVAGLIMAKAQV